MIQSIIVSIVATTASFAIVATSPANALASSPEDELSNAIDWLIY